MARKVLLLLALALVAIGFGASAGSASAANCSATPYAPQPLLYGMYTTGSFYCTNTSKVQFYDHVFRGGYADDWWLTNGVGGPFEFNTPSAGNYSVSNSVGGCPGGTQGIPYWWGHWYTYRVFNAATATWGSWVKSVLSGGNYFACP